MILCEKCRGTAAFRLYLIRARIRGRFVTFKRNLCAACGVAAHTWRAPMVYPEDGEPMEDKEGNQMWGRYVVSCKIISPCQARSEVRAPTYKQGNDASSNGSRKVASLVEGLTAAQVRALLSR